MLAESLIFFALVAGSDTSTESPRTKRKSGSSGPPGGRPANRPAGGRPSTRGRSSPPLSGRARDIGVGGGLGNDTEGGTATEPPISPAEHANTRTPQSPPGPTVPHANNGQGGSPERTEAAGKARRDAKATTGAMTGAKWGGKFGGKYGKIAGAIGGGILGGRRGKKQGEEKEEKKEGEGPAKKVHKKAVLAKEALKAYADYQLKKMAWANAGETFGLSVIAYYGIKHWKVTLTIIIALFLIFFDLFDASTFDLPQQQGATTPTTSDTCAPSQFTGLTGTPFGQTSVCTITVTYDGSAQDVEIVDTILPGTAFVSASNKGTYDKTSNTVTWDAEQLNLPLNPINITVTVTVKITTHQNNTTVYNAYTVNPNGLTSNSNGGGPVAIPGNLPPSTNNCSGIYYYYMSITPGHQNYGDPTCTLVEKDPNGVAIINKDAILAELKKLSPSEAMGWFMCVVPNESGYNANAYLAASTSGKGAYGLVQMNPTGAGNGKFDNGQVIWPLQLSNGINYNNQVIGHTFSYWPTSYDSCLRNYGVTVN